MDTMVTLKLLQTICPRTRVSTLEKFVGPLNDVAWHYELIGNPRRLAGFLAQLAHESGGFNVIKENMNYSAERLQVVFRKYFPNAAIANKYARKPEMIGSRVYANRMNNGDEASGDGWRFHGRGLIQLTGRYNYTKLAEALEISVDECVEYLSTTDGAVSSAGWFWDTNDLSTYSDNDDFIGLTKRINGGTNGLSERQHYYNIALKALQE